MIYKPMNWKQKVEQVLNGRSLKHVELAAGWSEGSLSASLNPSKERVPYADRGVRLAKALGVPAEWLFDDEADWPPPATTERIANTAQDLTARLLDLVVLLLRERQQLSPRVAAQSLLDEASLVALVEAMKTAGGIAPSVRPADLRAAGAKLTAADGRTAAQTSHRKARGRIRASNNEADRRGA